MGRGARFAPFFQRLIDLPEEAMDALRRDPEAFAEALHQEERGLLKPDAAIFAHDALASLVFDQTGLRVPMPTPQWMPPIGHFSQLIPGDNGRLISIRHGEGSALYGLWASSEEALAWNLAPAVRDAIAAHRKGRIAVIAGGASGDGPIASAALAYGLTDLERRVVSAVIRSGSGRRATDELGIAYSTVRETLSRASRKMGAANLPAMVHRIVAAAFGIFPDEGDTPTLLADILPLTERQAAVAAMVAAGLTREQAAAGLGLSIAVVKKELEAIYATLGVESSAELARLVAEARALRLVARATDAAPGFLDPAFEPTRLHTRPAGGGVVAWSDHGPRSGKPVLLVHSNWSCRPAPRPLLRLLQGTGFRPITIDRPGFGQSALGRSTRADPFSQAIEDTLAIFDSQGFGRVPVVARCGAQFVLSLKAAAPDRVGPVLLVSPSPQTGDDGLRRGIVGVIKESFYRSPRLIEFFFRIICAQVSLQRTETLTRAIVAGCPTDEKMCDDPAFIRDRLRAIRPFSVGNLAGAIFEENIISHGGYRFATTQASDWVVMQGETDTHNGLDEVKSYWATMAPNARFVAVSDGGRFMTSSHPELVVETLCGLLP